MLTIKDWAVCFENAHSRKVERLTWVRMPVTHGVRYHRLIRLPGGVEAFAVFISLVQIAAMSRTRGELSDDTGSALGPEDLVAATGIPLKTLEKSIGILSRPDIGWIVYSTHVESDSTELESGSHQRREEERREEEKREETGEAPVATTRGSPGRRTPRIGWNSEAGWSGISDQDRADWGLAYPACSLDVCLPQMTEWCRANPTKAHKSNWRKFIVNWLKREQDRGGTVPHANGLHKPKGYSPDDLARLSSQIDRSTR